MSVTKTIFFGRLSFFNKGVFCSPFNHFSYSNFVQNILEFEENERKKRRFRFRFVEEISLLRIYELYYSF